MAKIIVATVGSWNVSRFHQWESDNQHDVHLITGQAEFNLEAVIEFAPHYIFFPQWYWKIPEAIFENYECVVFHMTDLPFGRGGSPLQNLILRGIYRTQLSAIRVVEVMDSGPVYLKHPLSLHGSATEIYIRASETTFEMIDEILESRLTPKNQKGEVVKFKRRTASESEIPPRDDLQDLYDFIRMLDAEGYPQAFLTHAGYRYEFSRASLRDGHIVADVMVVPLSK
ncbi:MAG: hypothetical protein MK000_01485 [Anaerolineales bacterium]|nr:hypothetical protein [Anaerolineales bacterium]